MFSRRHVLVELAPLLYGWEPRLIEAAASRLLADPEAIPIVGVAGAVEPVYALASVIAPERAITERVAAGLARCGPPPPAWPRPGPAGSRSSRCEDRRCRTRRFGHPAVHDRRRRAPARPPGILRFRSSAADRSAASVRLLRPSRSAAEGGRPNRPGEAVIVAAKPRGELGSGGGSSARGSPRMSLSSTAVTARAGRTYSESGSGSLSQVQGGRSMYSAAVIASQVVGATAIMNPLPAVTAAASSPRSFLAAA